MGANYYFLTNQLNEVETGIVTSIISHIENGERKVNIAQIANENFVSTAFISKMCKRLGFSGYTDMVFQLSRQHDETKPQSAYDLQSLIDNYEKETVNRFVDCLRRFHNRNCFVVGAGFADVTADYITHRMAVCGFPVFNRVHFYDYVLFRDSNGDPMQSNIEPSFLIAISQSGETDMVLNDVRRAKQNGFQIISFTKMENSTLAGLSDITFVVDSARQALISPVPNPFFGKVILAMEELLGIYFKK